MPDVARPTAPKWLVYAIVVLLPVMMAYAAWSTMDPRVKNANAKPAAKLGVEVAEVQIGPMPDVLEATGKALPSSTVEIRAQVGGILKSVLVKDGDRIEVGQPLFEIDDVPLKAALALAEAQWEKDKALAENALDTETRLKPLAQSGATTKKDYVTAVNMRVSLMAAADASKAQIEQARIALGYAKIASPIAGRAGAILVKAGNLISTANGAVPLLVVNAVTPADVQFSIAQHAFKLLRKAQTDEVLPVEIRDTGRAQLRARGTLAFLDNAFNELSGTIMLRARISNEREELWPGEFVAVRIVLRTDPQAVSIPEVVLQEGQAGSYVFVAANGQARLRQVKVSRIVDGRAVITDGLSSGDKVITRLPTNLRDGSNIDIRSASPALETPVALH